MKTTLGERLKTLRDEYRLSQTAFSNRIGISYVAYANIERGQTENPQQNTLNSIIKEFATTEDWLLHEKGSMLPNGKRNLPTNTNPSSEPWKDEAWRIVNDQLAKKDLVIDRLTQALLGGVNKTGFHKALNQTGQPQGRRLSKAA